MLSIYPACFYKEEDGYSVIFPDLNYLATQGDDLEDAINGYYNDDKYFMRVMTEDEETLIYMKNVVMISIQKLKEKKSENKGKGKKRYAVALLKETEDENKGKNEEI